MKTLSDFIVTKNADKSAGFNANKMSGRPCTRKQAYCVANFTLESFIQKVFESDPRENESESMKKSFNNRIKARVSKVLLDDKKFDSDACQAYFEDNSKALPKRIMVKVTKSFKEHNQEKTPVDMFLKVVATKL
tara:strand:- start:784 stop:1185 length:402 start_codon:yes stop_codon:yes gene_type:complete